MRGYQKKVIYLKDTGSDFFDEAYFIVSRECEISGIEKGDMVLEASRIIEESLGIKTKSKKDARLSGLLSRALPFLSGATFSAVLITAITVLL